MTKVKWATNEKGSWWMTAAVKDRLPAGYYDMGLDQVGNLLFSEIKLNTDNLYLLPRSTTDTVMQEIQDFWTKKDAFKKYGFLFKRGVLLYGPPGTGKTSLINLVVAEAAKLDAICLRMGSPGMAKIGMQTLREAYADRPIIVFIEDIDRWASHSEEELLSLLDGSDQVDNVVFIATTNYLSSLPARIVNRPSRFDRRIEVGAPSVETKVLFFENLSKEPGREEWTEWAQKTEGLSFAHLKEIFIAVKILGLTFDQAMENVKDLDISEEDEGEDEDDGWG